LLFNIYS